MKQNIYLAEDASSVLEESCSARKVIAYARWMLLAVVILTLIGLTMLYSASYGTAGLKFFRNQMIWVTLGMLGGLLVFFAGYKRIATKAVY
jgi:cell division protein FtsW